MHRELIDQYELETGREYFDSYVDYIDWLEKKVSQSPSPDVVGELAICQLHCAEQFFCGGGIDLDSFITSNGLNTKQFLNLAIHENIDNRIIDAIIKNIK